MSSIQSIIPTSCKLGEFVTIQKGVEIGEDVRINNYCNLYGCKLEHSVMLGTYVEVQNDCVIGELTRVQSHSFIPACTTIGKNCFISHNFTGVNDTFSNGEVNFKKEDWGKIVIGDNVVIGSSVTMFPIKVGSGAIIGANSLCTKDIGENEVWYGSPAVFVRMRK